MESAGIGEVLLLLHEVLFCDNFTWKTISTCEGLYLNLVEYQIQGSIYIKPCVNYLS